MPLVEGATFTRTTSSLEQLVVESWTRTRPIEFFFFFGRHTTTGQAWLRRQLDDAQNL